MCASGRRDVDDADGSSFIPTPEPNAERLKPRLNLLRASPLAFVHFAEVIIAVFDPHGELHFRRPVALGPVMEGGIEGVSGRVNLRRIFFVFGKDVPTDQAAVAKRLRFVRTATPQGARVLALLGFAVYEEARRCAARQGAASLGKGVSGSGTKMR